MDPQQIQNPTPNFSTEQIKPPHSHKILWILLSVFILLVVAGLFVFKFQIKEKNESSLSQNVATTTLEEIELLPPDPGEGGKKTITGVDFDKDGVRDDIQRYITLNYGDVSTQSALRQFIIVEQNMILHAGDKSKVRNYIIESFAGWNCLRYIRGDDEANNIIDTIDRILLNTPERMKSSDLADASLSGTVLPRLIPGGDESACGFKPVKFLNATSTDTSSWKTYRNEEYGFEFKYPGDAKIEQKQGGYAEIYDEKERSYLFNIAPNDSIGIIKDFYNSRPTFSMTEDYFKKNPSSIYLGKVVVNGRTGFQFGYCEPVCVVTTVFQNTSDSFLTFNSINSDKISLLYTQVLSTFKFTTPSVTKSPITMDEFTSCLGEKGATFYGTFWCPHCQGQKARFDASADLLPYVECSTSDSMNQTQVCIDKKINVYPTWEFFDKSRLTGELSLEELAQKTSCELPDTLNQTKKSLNPKVSLYFKLGMSEHEILALKDLLSRQDWVKSVNYLSAEQNLIDFKNRHKNEPYVLQALNELLVDGNPLGAILTVYFKDQSQSKIGIEFIKAQKIYSSIDKLYEF